MTAHVPTLTTNLVHELMVVSNKFCSNMTSTTTPPIRYGDVGILMNIITKPLDTGYTTGFDVCISPI